MPTWRSSAGRWRLCGKSYRDHFCSRRGSSHYRARGRYLWRKDASPLDPHQKHGGRHRPPYPLWAQRPGAPAPAFGIQPPRDWTGERYWARRHELPAKSRSPLPAAPMNIPRRTASPHLGAWYLPRRKIERPQQQPRAFRLPAGGTPHPYRSFVADGCAVAAHYPVRYPELLTESLLLFPLAHRIILYRKTVCRV